MATAVRSHEVGDGVVKDGDLKYTFEEGTSGAKASYQEASGAPVESKSPLGMHVGWATVFLLNLGKIIGTGAYSTPALVLSGAGSVGLSLVLWVIGYFLAISGVMVYLEYVAYFPNRSGGEAVFLEQAYPRPKYLFPAAFAFQTVIFSFSSSNAIVFAQYVFRIAGTSPTAWELKGVAVAGYVLAILFVAFSTKYSLWFSNAIGVVKVLSLVFIAITGFVVLGGHTRVEDPHMNFRNAFEGSSTSAYQVTSAVLKVVFANSGYENAFQLANEMKDPVKTLKVAGPASVTLMFVLFFLVNIAYFAAVPKSEFRTSKEVAASLFFTAVFGRSRAVNGLNILVVLSTFGNLVSTLIGTSRLIRECGRQGVLPYPKIWASTKPFGTPLAPYLAKFFLTLLMILAPPAGDAFSFLVNLILYPDAMFKFLMAVGLFVLRWRRKRSNLPQGRYKAWNIFPGFYTLMNLFLLIMPWVPPPAGKGDYSFWYGTSVVVGMGLILLCVVYYWIWIYALPHWKGYRIRQEVLVLESGAQAHRLVKVPLAKLDDWDSKHDAAGRRLNTSSSHGSGSDNDEGYAKAETVKEIKS